MTGSLAQTIQGEAGSNPANQFAVASTIYNRMQAGNFPGGTNPTAIVNAPQQFVGFNATPNASAQQFAAAIENGTLPNYGTTGNAVNFQSGATAARNGFTNGGANIGGNYFSDRFGAPTSNFVAPAYGAAGSTIADGGANNSSGVAAGSGAGSASDPLGTSVTDSKTGASSSTNPPSDQTPTNVIGLDKTMTQAVQDWMTQAETGIGDAFTKAFTGASDTAQGWFGAAENWVIRAGLILFAIILIAVGLMMMTGQNVKVSDLKKLAAA